jgi:hypothetical protein
LETAKGYFESADYFQKKNFIGKTVICNQEKTINKLYVYKLSQFDYISPACYINLLITKIYSRLVGIFYIRQWKYIYIVSKVLKVSRKAVKVSRKAVNVGSKILSQ